MARSERLKQVVSSFGHQWKWGHSGCSLGRRWARPSKVARNAKYNVWKSGLFIALIRLYWWFYMKYFLRYLAFHGWHISFPLASLKWYDPNMWQAITIYGPSHYGASFPYSSVVVSISFRTKSPTLNNLGLTLFLKYCSTFLLLVVILRKPLLSLRPAHRGSLLALNCLALYWSTKPWSMKFSLLLVSLPHFHKSGQRVFLPLGFWQLFYMPIRLLRAPQLRLPYCLPVFSSGYSLTSYWPSRLAY